MVGRETCGSKGGIDPVLSLDCGLCFFYGPKLYIAKKPEKFAGLKIRYLEHKSCPWPNNGLIMSGPIISITIATIGFHSTLTLEEERKNEDAH